MLMFFQCERGVNPMIQRQTAIELLQKYNKEAFHIRHALTVEQVMRHFANEEGFLTDIDFWGLVGLLHDIDFEMFPEKHCLKAPELLSQIDAPSDMVHAICAHAHSTRPYLPEPEHKMEKLLFAADELTGLIYAASLMRPSKSTRDMELKSLKKKYKDKAFAAGCSRDIIAQGAELLGWELDELLRRTLTAMQESEEAIEQEYARLVS